MSEELEPFRKAAELGCEDFENLGRDNMVLFHLAGSLQFKSVIPSHADDGARINRHAAAVCECWWREWAETHNQYQSNGYDIAKEWHNADGMIDLCRAFGRKYGGTQA